MTSKLYLAAIILISFTTGCSNNTQTAAEQHAAKIDEASQTTNFDVSLPGTTKGTMPAGCYMRAEIDGKKWEATEMTPDTGKLSIMTVNGKGDNHSLTFVIGSKRDGVGQPRNLGPANQIFYTGGEGFFLGAESGQVTVTKIDDDFIEGKFDFTAEKEGRKVTASNGEFRVPGQGPPAN